jgi:hypothetical protein
MSDRILVCLPTKVSSPLPLLGSTSRNLKETHFLLYNSRKHLKISAAGVHSQDSLKPWWKVEVLETRGRVGLLPVCTSLWLFQVLPCLLHGQWSFCNPQPEEVRKK